MERIYTPFFSIIIPTFNRATLLRRALESVQEQTYRHFEVIVADDGSTDDTAAVVKSFDRLAVRYLWDENWGGPARPRNRAIGVAKGDWLAFLDADDWWYPEKLERMARLTSSCDVISHHLDNYISDHQKVSVQKARRVNTADVFTDLMLYGNAFPNSATVVRTELVRRVGLISEDRELISLEDFDLWLRISRHTNRFCVHPEPLGAYWLGGDNISAPSLRFAQVFRRISELHIKELAEPLRSKHVGKLSYEVARVLHRASDFQPAIREYKNALGAAPWSLRIKCVLGIALAVAKVTK